MAKRMFFVVLALLALFGGIFGWKFYTIRQQIAAQSGGPPPPVVATATVAREAWTPVVAAVEMWYNLHSSPRRCCRLGGLGP